ncbi:MAG: D-2-hydroxyacid dehydrogenase [Chloroflexi bacterium]|nr:D-2-hydroxyacid dehydrogenase [Chloroflexota bacterium]
MPDSDSKPRIVVTVNVPDSTLDALRASAPAYRVDKYAGEVPNAVWLETEVLFTSRVYPTPEQAPRLRWIQTCSAGFDWALTHPIAQHKDILITSVSGIHATPIAEYCLGMMLALNLKIPTMIEYKREKSWGKDRNTGFGPAPLRGKTVGIVGYGSIGRELARLCEAIGMNVLAAKRDVMHVEAGDAFYLHDETGDPQGEIPARIYPGQAIATMARECDFLVVTVPLTGGTRHLIDIRVFDAMKETAYFLNIARGDVVDEQALIGALQTQRIAGAALDVFAEEPLPATSPLWGLPNVIISPHVAGNTPDYNERSAKVFAENLRRYVERKVLMNALNRTEGY